MMELQSAISVYINAMGVMKDVNWIVSHDWYSVNKQQVK